jgi:acyl carrier protein
MRTAVDLRRGAQPRHRSRPKDGRDVVAGGFSGLSGSTFHGAGSFTGRPSTDYGPSVAREPNPTLFPAVRSALAVLVPKGLHRRITPSASILADLGLDSLKVVELTVLLEKQLGRPVFLPEWIASVEDPADLTVASLAHFLDRQP